MGTKRSVESEVPVRQLFSVICVLLSVLTLGSASANAAVGPDPTFGDRGVATISTRSELEPFVTLDVLADGNKVVQINQRDTRGVSRYLANGQPDASFGGDGIVDVTIDGYGKFATIPEAGVLDDSRRVVVGGSVQVSSPDGATTQDVLVMLQRFNSDGTRDASFGSEGVVTQNISPPPWIGETITGVDVDSQGRILVTGSRFVENVVEPGELTYQLPRQGFVARYLDDGSLDTTFRENGITFVSVDVGTEPTAIQLDDQGRSVVAVTGLHSDGEVVQPYVMRMTDSGELDENFGIGGKVLAGPTEARASDLALADGSILVTGQEAPGAYVSRLTASGHMDESFGSDGTVNVSFDAEFRGDAYGSTVDVTVTDAGQVLVAGSVQNRSGNRVAIQGFSPDGSVASGMGANGVLQSPAERDSLSSNGLMIDKRSRIVVGATRAAFFGDSTFNSSAIRFTSLCAGRAVTLMGTAGRDRINGTAGRDVVSAGSGDDTIRTFGSSDVVCGGNGKDRMVLGRGNDRGFGQANADTILGGSGRDRLFGGLGKDRLFGGLNFDIERS